MADGVKQYRRALKRQDYASHFENDLRQEREYFLLLIP